jgi:hypothetical protein
MPANIFIEWLITVVNIVYKSEYSCYNFRNKLYLTAFEKCT